MLHAARHQPVHLLIGQYACVFRKTREVDVMLQQLLRVWREAIVQRVDKVEAHRSAAEFKPRRSSPLYRIRVNFLPPKTIPII